MKIKNQAKIVLPAFAAVVALAGLVTAVSAQSGPSLDALTESLKTKTEAAISAGNVSDGVHDGEKVFTGDSAKQLVDLHRQASNAKEESLARPASERSAAVAKIRAFSGNDGLNPEYVSTSRSSYNNQVNAEFFMVGKDYFEVDMRTNEIVQFGPAPLAIGEAAKVYNTEAKFAPEQLEVKAREFIAKNAPNADLSKLTASTGEKSGTNFFFRFADESRKVDGTKPFVQVGFTVGGDLLSYTNTLGL